MYESKLLTHSPSVLQRSPSELRLQLLKRLEKFLNEKKYEDAQQLWKTLLKTTEQFAETEWPVFLKQTELLIKYKLDQKQFNIASEQCQQIINLCEQMRLAGKISADLVIGFLLQLGRIYLANNSLEESLSFFAEAFCLAKKYNLIQLVLHIEDQLEQLESIYLATFLIHWLTQQYPREKIDFVSKDRLCFAFVPIGKVADLLIQQRQPDQVKKFYEKLNWMVERYFNLYDAELHKAKYKSLDMFQQVLNEFHPFIDQITRHGQYKLAIQFYQKAIDHAEVEAKTFDTSSVLAFMEEVYSAEEQERFESITVIPTGKMKRQQLVDLRQQMKTAYLNNITPSDVLKKFTFDIKSFLKALLDECQELMGAPPCDYCLLGIGSISRDEMYPYSDLDCALLIAEEACRHDSYFPLLIRLFKFKLDLLCEEKLPGLHIDSGDLSHFISEEKTLIDTPAGYIKKFDPFDVDVTQPEPYSIHRPTFIYASEKGENLLSEYMELLEQRWQSLAKIEDIENLASQLKTCQQKALAYWLEHLRQLAVEKERDGSMSIDIKQRYIGPLVRWCTNLGLYQGLKIFDVPSIINQLEEQECIHPHFIKILKKALRDLQILRLRIHFTMNYQSDIVLKPGKTPQEGAEHCTLTEEEYQCLQQIDIEIFRPLSNIIGLWQQHKLVNFPIDPIVNYCDDLLSSIQESPETNLELLLESLQTLFKILLEREEVIEKYIYFYRRIPEPVREKILSFLSEMVSESKTLKNQIIFSTLESYPFASGRQFLVLKQRKCWELILKRAFSEFIVLDDASNSQKSSSRKNPVILETLSLDKIALSENWLEYLFDKSGKLKTKKLTGQRLVIPVELGEQHFHLKVFPEFPGIEYAIERLHLWITGKGTTQSELMKLTIGKESYPILLSQTIQGTPLHLASNQFEKGATETVQLDHKYFSQLVLMTLLINPEDAKPDNYILQPCAPDNTSLVCLVGIDNDRAFVSPFRKESFFGREQLKLQVKTVIYCFDLMKEPLHPEAVEEFLALAPEQVLMNWLNELEIYDIYLRTLFTETEIADLLKGAKVSHQVAIPIWLKQGAISELYQTMCRIQRILKNKPTSSGIDLLTRIYPLLGQYYRQALSEDSSAVQRFRHLTYKEYKVSKDGTSMTALNTLQTLQTSLQAVPNIQKLVQIKDYTPTQSISELKVIQQQKNILMQIRKDLLQGNMESFQRLLVDDFKEQVISTIEFKTLKKASGEIDIDLQLMLINCMIGTSFRALNFEGCLALTDALLEQILSHSPDLKKINLSGCSQLTNSCLRLVARYCQFIHKMKLSRLANLSSMTPAFLAGPLRYPELTMLDISDCANLTDINIIAPKLQYFFAQGCVSLKTIITQSPILPHANLSSCINLTESAFSQWVKGCPSLLAVNLDNCNKLPNRELIAKQAQLAILPISTLSAEWKVVIEQLLDQSLKELDLWGKPITSIIMQFILEALKVNTSLTAIRLAANSLDSNNIKTFVSTLPLHHELAHFDCKSNNLGSENTELLCEALTTCRKLITLNFAATNIGLLGLKAVLKLLMTNPSLTDLILSWNEIEVAGTQLLADFLTEKDSLKQLNIRACQIGTKGMQILCSALKANTSLISLNLHGNGIDNDGVVYLADMLKVNHTLTHVDIQNNDISEKGMDELIDAMNKNFSVIEFNVDDNQMSVLQRARLRTLLTRNKKSKEQPLTSIIKKMGIFSEKLLDDVVNDQTVPSQSNYLKI